MNTGDRLIPNIGMAETVDLPLGETRRVLNEVFGDRTVFRLTSDRVHVEPVAVENIGPSDVVVLGTDDGRYDDFGWNPEADEVVLDLSLTRWPGIPLDVDLAGVRHWFDADNSVDPIRALARIAQALASNDDDLDPKELAEQAATATNALVPRTVFAGDWSSIRDSVNAKLDRTGPVPMLTRTVEH